jgi:hypothetical protein
VARHDLLDSGFPESVYTPVHCPAVFHKDRPPPGPEKREVVHRRVTHKRAIVGTMIQALYDAHDIEPELHRELQLMILAGGRRANGDVDDARDDTMHRVVRERVDAMDREVQAWLTEIIRRYAPSRDAETAAAVLFRSAEETIHRLKFFPETMPPVEKVIGELSSMFSVYLFYEPVAS